MGHLKLMVGYQEVTVLGMMSFVFTLTADIEESATRSESISLDYDFSFRYDAIHPVRKGLQCHHHSKGY